MYKSGVEYSYDRWKLENIFENNVNCRLDKDNIVYKENIKYKFNVLCKDIFIPKINNSNSVIKNVGTYDVFFTEIGRFDELTIVKLIMRNVEFNENNVEYECNEEDVDCILDIGLKKVKSKI